MSINWKVRIKNKSFWIAIVPAILLLVQLVASLFGCELDLSDTGEKILAIVNAVFAVLTIMGVINDPTTTAFSDSTRALMYEEPNGD